jgi:hypothetical protein
MKKTDIERIIKQGSVKQKIKLYFIDVAHFNTVGQYTAKLIGSGDIATVNRPDKILTDKERDIIFNSVKEPKDIKYWEELRTWNKAFLLFKPTITTLTKNFDLLTAQLSQFKTARVLHSIYEDVINDILEVVEDKKLRGKLVNTALKSLKQFDAIEYKEKGFLPFIDIPNTHIRGKVWPLVETLNKQIIEAKEYIKGIETFLNKNLPLQPYKQFVKTEEDNIKANIDKCRMVIKLFNLGYTVDNASGKALEVELQGEERLTILNWDEVEVEVTDEDIEDIKNAGI